jgi:hypothetical protein
MTRLPWQAAMALLARRMPGLALACLLAGTPARIEGQLRPLPPIDWTLFDGPHVATGHLGLGVLLDQRASLAGTEGRLLEVGDFLLGIRDGRVAVEVGGTMLRVLDDQTAFAEPFGGAREGTQATRRDAGDFRVSTLVLLTPPGGDAAAMLRFGTRLPTTDNEVGLDRDRTDFYALLAGRLRRARLWLGAEAGVGINGTHDERLEQSDVLIYGFSTGYHGDLIAPRISLVGHMDGMRGRTIRGNEELAEVRAGARIGRAVWGEIEGVYGLQPFSPRTGLYLRIGTTR